MKATIILEDHEGRAPTMDWEYEGEKTPKSLAYSLSILLRMVGSLMNSPYRQEILDYIGAVYKLEQARKEGANHVASDPQRLN